MHDRRRSTRRKTPCPTAVFETQNGKILGFIVNISVDGVMLKCEEPTAVDQPFELSIELPDPILGRRDLTVRAHSLWSQKSRAGSYHLAGFELLDLSSEDCRIIELLVCDSVYQRWVS